MVASVVFYFKIDLVLAGLITFSMGSAAVTLELFLFERDRTSDRRETVQNGSVAT